MNTKNISLANSLERSYCTSCNGKFYRKDLIHVYYKLLKKSAFHCHKCMSATMDNLQYNLRGKSPYLIELFSGSKSVSNTAESLGFKSFTIDIESKYSPDLVADISKINLYQFPSSDKVFIIWASVPCTYYSILNVSNHWDKLTYSHRKYYYIPKTKQARSAIRLLEKTLWLIRKINPVYFFIENPRGALRHMPQMQSIPFLHSISYSDYGMDIYKPTDIFTNCPFLELKQISRTNQIFENHVSNMNNSFERSKVPGQLISDIINQIKIHHSLNF